MAWGMPEEVARSVMRGIGKICRAGVPTVWVHRHFRPPIRRFQHARETSVCAVLPVFRFRGSAGGSAPSAFGLGTLSVHPYASSARP